MKLIKKIIPWLLALLLLAYLFYKIPPAKVLQALSHVNLPLLILYAFLYFILVMAIDCLSLSKVLTKFCVPVSVKEIFPPRAVSYLLALVNYNAGQAGLAYFIKRSKGASFFKTMGAIFFIMVIDLFWVVAMAFVGTFFIQLYFTGWDVSHWVRQVGFFVFAAVFLHLAFWRGWFGKISPWKVKMRWVDWVRGRHLFQAFHEATVWDYLMISLYRLPLHLVIVTSFYFAVTVFDAHIDYSTILGTVPVIILIGTIPLTPGGLGTVQASTIELLKDHVTGNILASGVTPTEILFAMSLTWMFSNYLLKALCGFIFLNRVDRAMFKEE